MLESSAPAGSVRRWRGPRCVPAARSCWPTAAARNHWRRWSRRSAREHRPARWPRVPEAVQGLQWDGRIVIDATNDFDPSDLKGSTSSQVLADLVPGARVVKAANTLGAAVLGSDPHEAGGRRVIFLSGGDAEAKSEVSTLFEDAGFVAIDLGGLVSGGALQQLGGPLSGVNLIKLG